MGLYLGKFRIGVELPAVAHAEKRAGYELRTYAPAVAAAVEAEGEALKGSDGFRALAGYIGAFGEAKNDGGGKIAMTAPVVTQDKPVAGTKIAMTAPVVTQDGSESYVMQFIMPSKYTSVGQLPAPTDSRVSLVQLHERTLAVRQFGGRATAASIEKNTEALLSALERDGVTCEGGASPREAPVELARYNDPFTPGFLRTNEVWIRVAASTAGGE